MPLPVPVLDDLRFQKDLVDEARRRIIHYCPDWTDYNLSDPGITLIELFAWMTEMILYRVNRIPEKNYVKFMEMLGMQLQPASSARVELTFRLSTPFPINPEDDTVAIVPRGTEVSTRQTDGEQEVSFTTDEKLIIRPSRLTEVRRAEEFNKNYLPRLGREGGEEFCVFEREPRLGDTFYLGFAEDEDISGHILRLTFECAATEGVGINRKDPPWLWECSLGDGRWEPVSMSTRPGEGDTTGGLNDPGSLVLYLPLSMKPDQVNGRNAYWVRCSHHLHSPGQHPYTDSPRVTAISAHSLGATTRATHAIAVQGEIVGKSNGDPGQVFHLQHTPILDLRHEDETVEVEEKRQGELVLIPWQRVSNFSVSTRYDRHFTLDPATGELCFGPAIRQPDGAMRQYGRIPQAGHSIRFKQYRYGGGVAGNVPAEKIQVLKSAIPYIDRVSNLSRAAGGRDQESLEEAKMRAQRELRAQQRAVTPEDYEDLARKASRTVARVKCNIPQGRAAELPPGMIEILLVPAVADALKAGDLSRLHVDERLIQEVGDHLDNYRLLTTTLQIKEPNYLGIKVEAEIMPVEYSQPEVVRARVVESLRAFLSPLSILEEQELQNDLMGHDWAGWPFGRSLFVAEIFSLIQRLPDVKHVLDVKLSQRPVTPRREGEETAPAGPQLVRVEEKVILVPEDTLLCSLDHQVTITRLGKDNNGRG